MFSKSHSKRPGPYHETDHTFKKRAPYATRACEVCKRRKSKCSGSEPCAYCEERSLHCEYATSKVANHQRMMIASRQPEHSIPLPTPAPSVDSSCRDSVSVVTSRSHPGEIRILGDEVKLSSLQDLVSSLQDQVMSLTSRLEQIGQESVRRDLRSISADTHMQSVNTGPHLNGCLIGSTKDLDQASAEAILPTRPRRRYHGPTSPEYSLHVAKRQMQMQVLQKRGIRSSMIGGSQITIDDGEDYDEDASEDEMDESGTMGQASPSPPSQIPWDTLLGFRDLLTQHLSVRLLHTYQHVFGDLHPMVDVGSYISLADSLYDQDTDVTDRDDNNRSYHSQPEKMKLLILNLILAVALSTEHTENGQLGQAIFSLCRSIAHQAVIPSAATIDSAIICILMGTYYFFRDNPQLAWRMCGLAGNMLLELGFHSPKYISRLYETHNEQTAAATIIGTTIILDRQWSAATGLPTHFQESHFHADIESLVEAPYLRAMVAFMSVSDNFTCPIARIASTGQAYEEDAEFETLKSQIEQWRENAVGEFDFTTNGNRSSQPIRNIPSWAILLNLRANNAHNMLLRPFFFTNNLTPGSRKHIEPATRLFSETISTISSLDQMTDDYRKQIPFYVHVLISACALMSLVNSHVAQHFSALRNSLPIGFAEMVKRDYNNALSLALAYQQHSRASRKLVKQLEILRPTLICLDILPQKHQHQRETRQDDSGRHQQSSGQNIPTLQLQSSRAHIPPEASSPVATDSSWQKHSASNGEPCSSVPGLNPDSTRLFLGVTADTVNPSGRRQNGSVNHNLYAADSLDVGDFCAGVSNLDSTIVPLDFGSDSNALQDWFMASGQNFFSEGELLNDRFSGWPFS